MLDKRFQVFVSSTFTDLLAERSRVIQTLMEMDCIPAGMELFPAMDEEQFEFIKKVIDDCDYYVLIIGGRYGSVAPEGVSYTEKEYDYAISKGLKVLAFVHKNPDGLAVDKSDIDADQRKKLAAFRERVLKGRLVKFWSSADELPGLVSLSLNKTIKTHPGIGWVRANSVASAQILNEVNELRKRNEYLESNVPNQHRIGITAAPILTIPAIHKHTRARIQSKWVQIIIVSETEAPLIDCEVRLTQFNRIHPDKSEEALVEEPVFCLWSQATPDEERRMTIPAGVPQRANLFYRDEMGLVPMATVHPSKILLSEGIKVPGKYRVEVVASARNARTATMRFIFEWGEAFDDITLR